MDAADASPPAIGDQAAHDFRLRRAVLAAGSVENTPDVARARTTCVLGAFASGGRPVLMATHPTSWIRRPDPADVLVDARLLAPLGLYGAPVAPGAVGERDHVGRCLTGSATSARARGTAPHADPSP